MPDTAIPGEGSLYESDFHAWTQDQAARLRAWPVTLRPNGLDVENLAEEVESMGISQRRELRSLLEQIFIHLLKMEFHPATEARCHWETEIGTFRIQAELSLRDSPSLKPRLPELAEQAWKGAFSHVSRRVAAEAPDIVPRLKAAGITAESSPYHLESQALESGWYPAGYEQE